MGKPQHTTVYLTYGRPPRTSERRAKRQNRRQAELRSNLTFVALLVVSVVAYAIMTR